MSKEDYLKVRPGDTVPKPPADFQGLPPGADPAAIQKALQESSKQPPVDAKRFQEMTGEEMSQQLIREEQQRPRPVGVSSFEATKGKKVQIAGKDVQLPPDAGIQGTVHARPLVDAQGRPVDAAGKPLTTPVEYTMLLVRRGDAKAFVGVRTGRIQHVEPPSQRAAFAFLEEALR